MRKVRILIADDHEMVRAGLKVILESQTDMAVVGEAVDGQEAIDQAAAAQPDVVIMDISMPHVNGLKAAAVIHERHPAVKVLALTRHAEEGYLKQLLRAGASGYVLKQSRSAELFQAIRAVATGGVYVDSTLAARVMPSAAGARRVNGGLAEAGLTAREEEVLRLLGWAYSNKEIADRLQLSVKTVETHKSKAMQKLGLHNRADIVRFALLQGWLQEE